MAPSSSEQPWHVDSSVLKSSVAAYPTLQAALFPPHSTSFTAAQSQDITVYQLLQVTAPAAHAVHVYTHCILVHVHCIIYEFCIIEVRSYILYTHVSCVLVCVVLCVGDCSVRCFTSVQVAVYQHPSHHGGFRTG